MYTNQLNIQMLIKYLKEYNIKKVIASPGTCNVSFVASIQEDDFFEVYSSVDERSAAYLACGLATESGEVVVLTCTGATASRNYVPGLTEAYYRRIPILVVTFIEHNGYVDHHIPQIIDRTSTMNDIMYCSVQIPRIYNDNDKWDCTIKYNKAMLELTHNGGGPVHINMESSSSVNIEEEVLPNVRKINRITDKDMFPNIAGKRICIFIGAHTKWSKQDTEILDKFCYKYNAVVVCDHTSNYKGNYRVLGGITMRQSEYIAECRKADLLIHIGEISGAYYNFPVKEVWRVHSDGKIRDTFKKLTNVFEMNEATFFEIYNNCDKKAENTNMYISEWKKEEEELRMLIPELPFSNIWIAQQTANRIPENSVIHFGILNSLRAWNIFEIPNSVMGYANTGGFGIDGGLSSLVGASLCNKNKLYFGVIGDLAFFYDMNVLGNRHIGKNIRLIIINNGKGTEFKNYTHPAAKFGDKTDVYIAAAGHFGNQSRELIKDYCGNLGFEYRSAENKEEYLNNLEWFVSEEEAEMSKIFEIFTDSVKESEALKIINTLKTPLKRHLKNKAKKIVKAVVGRKGMHVIRKVIR